MPVRPDDFHIKSGTVKNITSRKSQSNLLKFILAIFLIGDIVFFVLWLNLTEAKESLENKYQGKLTELTSYKGLYNKEKQNKNELQEKYDSLKKIVMNMTASVGDRNWPTSGGYDSGYKMFFYARKRILLKSVYVKSKSKGKTKFFLYDKSGDKIQNTESIELSTPKKWQKIILDFKVNEGRYYLTFEGDTTLFYHSKNLEYPYKIEGLMEITGSDSGDNHLRRDWYQYFYAWEVSWLFD